MEQQKETDSPVVLKIEGIQLPLPEAEDILRALRGGEIDAVLVAEPAGDQVYTLAGAERPYRLMIEEMSEGAVTLTPDGVISYCNRSFADMVELPIEQLMGSSIDRFFDDPSSCAVLLAEGKLHATKREVCLKACDGSSRFTLFSVSPLPLEDSIGLCIVVTDLTEQKRNQALMASRELEQSLRQQAEAARLFISHILESITDSYVHFTPEWRIDEINENALQIVGRPRSEILGKVIWDVFPHTVGGKTYQEYRTAMEENRQAHFEAESGIHPGRWFEIHAYPSNNGLAVYFRDITERKRAEEDRERLNKELAEANRKKDEFLALLSHELRNPLAPIVNAVEVLRRGDAGSPELDRARDIIDRQVRDLARLIDDLLDASRITSGKVKLNIESVELASLISRAVETALPLIDSRGHHLAVSIPSETLWLAGDPVRLGEVLTNLLNNAAKYTPRGGQIMVSAEKDSGEIVVRVRDTGVGISAEVLPGIFDLFTQADRSLDRSYGGLGIGLSLARGIVEMHGGAIEALSAGPGKGSEFIVRIPAAGEGGPIRIEDENRQTTEQARPRRILVVDDNEDSAETVALLMKMAGHEIAVAHDGQSALDEARRFRPEIVLLDVGLPVLHGYDVAKELRSLPENKHLLLIALTGYGQERDRQRALEAGFDFHLVKPVEFKQLEFLVRSYVDPPE